MSLVRRNGRVRYQRSVRRNGRVTSRYVASGDVAALVCDLDAIRRAEAEARREDERAALARIEAADRAEAQRAEAVHDLVRQTLEAAGFHRPKWGAWRRRRQQSMATEIQQRTVKTVMFPSSDPRGPDAPDDALARLIARVARLEPEAMTTYVVISGAGCRPEVESLKAEQIERVRRELAGPEPAPLVELLAGHAALCWHDMHRVEVGYHFKSREGHASEAAREAGERRRDRSQRRFLAACRSLAQVQRLGLPAAALQVNVGVGVQVNARAEPEPQHEGGGDV